MRDSTTPQSSTSDTTAAGITGRGGARLRGRPRRYQRPIDVLPGATRFSEDPEMQDPVWLVRTFKAFPQFHRLLDDATVTYTDGRPREPGDWPLLYLAYILSGLTEVAKFWSQWHNSPVWKECGFEQRPSYQIVWQRFAELEVDELRQAFCACATALLRHAIAHEDRIGRWVDYDGSAIQSAARLHHCCPDPAMCGKLDGRKAPQLLAKSETSQVNQQRHNTVEKDPGEHELPEHDEIGEDGWHYFHINGHLYRSRDLTSGFRMYANRTVWHGGNGMKAIDRFTGGTIEHLVISASRNEAPSYPELADDVEATLGYRPTGMSGDKALSFDSVFEYNTSRGIASAIAWRKTPAHHERETWDTDLYDRHGIPRCKHCGGPGDVDSPGMGLYFDRDNPRLRFRCRLGHTPECDQTQSIACEENWRMLIPLSRLTKTYHCLTREGKHSERIHHHTRQRYGAGGKDLTGRIKRRSLTATQLRFDASRIIEWFRILLRHGWLGSRRHLNTRQPRACKPGWHLANTLGIRRRQRVNRPYGPVALRLGLARTAAPPGQDPPDG